MGIKEVASMPGGKDLPVKVRGPFAQALCAEARGDYSAAQERLDRAIEKEQE